MLKNWTVITESTKSVLAREHYLNNAKHKNHLNTEAILSIFGSENTSLNIIKNCNKYSLQQAYKRKGGRPPTPALEFVYSLPKGIRPTPEQWREMLNHIMCNLAKSIGVRPKELAPITRAVVHQQNQSSEIRGSGDHLHLLLGKFTNDLTYLRDLQRKSTTRLMKQAFNTAMLDVMNIDHLTYIPQKNYLGHAKKRSPQWKVKAARQHQKIEDKANETTQSLMKLIRQANKWLEAFNDSDTKQMNRQYNRMIKEIGLLDTSNPTLPEEELLTTLRNLIKHVDHKVDSRVSNKNKTELAKSLHRLIY